MLVPIIILLLCILCLLFYIHQYNNVNYAILADCEYQNGNISKSRDYYLLSVEDGNYLSNIKLGDIYNYNWEDRNMAKQYYMEFIRSYTKDPDRYKYYNLFNTCVSKLEELVNYDKINNIPEEKINLEDINTYLAQVIAELEEEVTVNEEPIIVEQPIEIIEPPLLDFIEYQFNDDDQNVHDVYVNKSATNSINTLKANTNYKYNSADVHTLLLDKDPTISNVLNRIARCYVKNSYNELTNDELLTLIVNRIEDYTDVNKKADAYNFLLTNLKDCINGGKVVCHTGINNRLIQSLSIVDESVDIKNKELYQQEMLNTAARLRNEHGDENLKAILLSELKKNYIDTNILNQHQLDDIVSEWIDYV